MNYPYICDFCSLLFGELKIILSTEVVLKIQQLQFYSSNFAK